MDPKPLALSAITALVLLSGCIAQAGNTRGDASQAGAASGQAAPDVQHYKQSFTFTDTELHTAVSQDSFGNNCLWIEGDLHILKGTMTATWSAATPVSASFSLYAMNWPTVVTSTEGASPAKLDFKDLGELQGQGSFYLLGFELDQTAPIGANVQQSVTFDVAFDYTGSEPSVSPNASCAIGY